MRELVLTSVRKKEDFWRMEYTISEMRRPDLITTMFDIRKDLKPVNSGVVEDFGLNCMAWADFHTRSESLNFLEKLSHEMSLKLEVFSEKKSYIQDEIILSNEKIRIP
jgi:hypothetical protein